MGVAPDDPFILVNPSEGSVPAEAQTEAQVIDPKLNVVSPALVEGGPSDSALSARRSPPEEEMGDGDDSEWMIKVSDAPPPAWAKRKEPGDGEPALDGRQRKRKKTR